MGGGASSWHRVVSLCLGLGTFPSSSHRPGCLQWFIQVDPLQQRSCATATVLPTPSPGFFILLLYILYYILYFEMINCYNSSADHLATHRPTGSWWRSQPRFVELSHGISVVSALWYSELIFVTTATTGGEVFFSNWCPF